MAFVVETEAGTGRAQTLKDYTLAHGAPYAHPRDIFFLDALPLGGTGKVDRAALVRRAVDLSGRS